MKFEKDKISQVIKMIGYTLCLILMCPVIASAQTSYKFERMWPSLEHPWYFSDPYDVAADDEGYVYVVNEKNGLIQKFSADGDFVTAWGKEGDGDGDGDGELYTPRGIAADSRGYVYVADTGNHRIQKFTAHGEFLTQWGTQGSGEGQFDRPYGIDVDRNGYVYVSDTYNQRIQKFTRDGKFLGGWEEKKEDFRPYGITTDQNGNIYVVYFDVHCIRKFNSRGEILKEWGCSGGGAFNYPYGIAADKDGNLYVTDQGNARIQKFIPDKDQWIIYANENENFREPKGIAVDHNGYIYVADRSNQHIQKLSSDGQFITRWGSGQGVFNSPEGIAFDRDGYFYVVDSDNHRVQKFTADGIFIDKWGGTYGEEEGQFKGPAGIAIDSEGIIYVADHGNFRVQTIDKEGVFTKWEKIKNPETGFPLTPYDIAIDKNDNIYVVYPADNRLLKFNKNGELLVEWGEEQGINDPMCIAVDEEGFVYISSNLNNYVQKYTPTGEPAYTPTGELIKWGGNCCKIGDDCDEQGKFCFPWGLTVHNGTVYVADSKNSRVQVFDTDGNFITMWGEIGNNPGQMNYPHDVAVSPDGKVYVSDTSNHRIQVFRPAALTNKAIIVAGGGPFPGNKLWDATQVRANTAYQTLLYQGFDKDTIYYLTSDTDIDTEKSTNENLKRAIKEWAIESPVPDNLIVYLVDHGGDGIFRMNGTENLTASKLANWFDTPQNRIPGRIILIYDACNSGSFLSALNSDTEKRIVITSTSPGQDAYFISEGSVSFSNYFWTQISNGRDISDAFCGTDDIYGAAESITKATAGLQIPLLNGYEKDSADCDAVQGIYIGNGTDMQSESPEIYNPEFMGEDILRVIAEDPDNDIVRVWAVIAPPDYLQNSSDIPVLGLPSIELMPVKDDADQYEGTYDKSKLKGNYVFIYAKDKKGNTSVCEAPVAVPGDNSLKRRAIISLGEIPDESMKNDVKLAYKALSFQGYSDETICLISPDDIGDLKPDQYPSPEAITECTKADTQDLVLYLVGNRNEDIFQMNASCEEDSLSSRLDELQNDIPGQVTVRHYRK